jgi:phospholipid/cholesterol/gamma-HCH transport system substrate-binding protein
MPQSRERRREVWVGLFVLLGLVAVFGLLFTFTEPSTFRRRYVLYALVGDAGGIRRGDAVELRGVSIGRVKGFDISPAGVRIRMEIEHNYKLPRDSTVEISSSGLLGGMVAEIQPGQSGESATAGQVLPGKKEEAPIEAVNRVAVESEKLIQRMQGLFSEQTVESVTASSEELQQLLAKLSAMTDEERQKIGAITQTLGRASKNLERVTGAPELTRSLQRLDEVTAGLQRTVASLQTSSRSLEVVTGRLERGEGTLGRLSKDETLYLNANGALMSLNTSAAELRRLATDLREHPQRYVHFSVF